MTSSCATRQGPSRTRSAQATPAGSTAPSVRVCGAIAAKLDIFRALLGCQYQDLRQVRFEMSAAHLRLQRPDPRKRRRHLLDRRGLAGEEPVEATLFFDEGAAERHRLRLHRCEQRLGLLALLAAQLQPIGELEDMAGAWVSVEAGRLGEPHALAR